jgi:hypothetical protein
MCARQRPHSDPLVKSTNKTLKSECPLALFWGKMNLQPPCLAHISLPNQQDEGLGTNHTAPLAMKSGKKCGSSCTLGRYTRGDGFESERRHWSTIEYQVMPSLREVAHDGWLCTFTIYNSSSAAPVRATDKVRKRQAVLIDSD